MDFNDNDFFGAGKPPNALAQTSQDQANNSPFGEGSMFYQAPCDNRLATYEAEGVDIIKIRALLQRLGDKPVFNYKEYLITDTTPYPYLPDNTQVKQAVFEHNIQQNIDKQLGFSVVQMNCREGKLENEANFSIAFDAKRKILSFSMIAYYESEQEENVLNNRLGVTYLLIEEELKALELKTNSTSGLLDFLEATFKPIASENFINSLKRLYLTEVNNNAEEIQWFFSQMPITIIKHFKKEELWHAVTKLLEYDLSKWLVDNSRTTIKVLEALLGQPDGFLYVNDQFVANPILAKKLYYALDHTGYSVYANGGKQTPYHTIFATMLCMASAVTRGERGDSPPIMANLTIGDMFKVYNELSDKAPPNQFALHQMELELWKQAISVGISNDDGAGWEVKELHNLEPMDLVKLTLLTKDKPAQTIICPAIFVKDKASVAEWAELAAMAEVMVDILAIAGGIVVLATSANPILLMAAVAEIGLAAGNLLVKAVEDELKETEWGREFLSSWEEFYEVGGSIVGVVGIGEIVESVLRSGVKVIAKGVTDDAGYFVESEMTKAIAQQHFGNQVTLGTKSIPRGSELSGVKPELQFLEKHELLLVRLEDELGEPTYKAVYQGVEIVPPSSEQDFIKAMKKPLNDGEDAAIGELKRMLLESKKRQAKYKKFKNNIDNLKKSRAVPATLELEEIVGAIKSYTRHGNAVAKIIEQKKMSIAILSREKYIAKIRELEGSSIEVATTKAEQMPAFAYRNQTYYLEPYYQDIEEFLAAVTHEGSHVRDHLDELKWIDSGMTKTEIKKKIGSYWDEEKKAYEREHDFRKETGIALQFSSKKSIDIHVEKSYENY